LDRAGQLWHIWADKRKKKEADEIEKAYNDALKKTTREQPAKKTDPWGSIR
jgi:hypothetical protein